MNLKNGFEVPIEIDKDNTTFAFSLLLLHRMFDHSRFYPHESKSPSRAIAMVISLRGLKDGFRV